jgi:hypothetical protein
MALPKLCSIEGCDKRRKGHGLCPMHLDRLRRNGSPHALRAKPQYGPLCLAIDCERPPERGRRGLCGDHFRLFHRRGDANAPRLRAKHGEPEQWLRDHVGFEGDECLAWPFARHTDGSAAIGSRYSRQGARLMCALAHGEPPLPSYQAAHKCGKGHRGCVNPRHLRWASPHENTWDKEAHGTMLRGASHPNAKLSEHQVRAIRLLGSNGFEIADICDLLAVNWRTAANVLSGKSWGCLA